MKKYSFGQYKSSAYQRDPIFKNEEFDMFGNADGWNAPILFTSGQYRYVLVSPDDIYGDEELVYKIATYLFHHPVSVKGTPITYFLGEINKCDEISQEFSRQITKTVSYEMIEEWFPKNISEINERIISYFLEKQTHYGQEFEWTENDRNYLMFIPTTLDAGAQNRSYDFITKQIFSKGLLSKTRNADNRIWFTISEDAIENYQKAKRNSQENKLAFIAIKFKDNEKRIQAIQKAIALAGYEPRIMNEYETNNWIMPEIFYQIRLAKFVVVDLSLRCDGAYYEAGYAYALEKEVIHLYDNREKENNPLHFDVAQKSTVMYDDYDELVEKLVNRIRATV